MMSWSDSCWYCLCALLLWNLWDMMSSMDLNVQMTRESTEFWLAAFWDDQREHWVLIGCVLRWAAQPTYSAAGRQACSRGWEWTAFSPPPPPAEALASVFTHWTLPRVSNLTHVLSLHLSLSSISLSLSSLSLSLSLYFSLSLCFFVQTSLLQATCFKGEELRIHALQHSYQPLANGYQMMMGEPWWRMVCWIQFNNNDSVLLNVWPGKNTPVCIQ